MANVSSFSGAMPVIPGGEVEVYRATKTSSVTVSNTTVANGTDVFSPTPTFIADGTSSYIVEFYSPYGQTNTTLGERLYIHLTNGGLTTSATDLGQIGMVGVAGGDHRAESPIYCRYIYTPSAGTVTLNVRGKTDAGTQYISAGTGGAAAIMPAYIRISKIVNQNDGLKPFWTPPVVTSLPSQATVGDQVIYAADATNGVYWQLQYDGLGTYPWKFIGGAPWQAFTAGSTTATAGSAASGGTPSIAIPLPGDYLIGYGALVLPGASASGHYGTIQPAYDGATISGDHELGASITLGYFPVSAQRSLTFTTAKSLSLFYRSDPSAGTSTFLRRYINATPVRVKAA